MTAGELAHDACRPARGGWSKWQSCALECRLADAARDAAPYAAKRRGRNAGAAQEPIMRLGTWRTADVIPAEREGRERGTIYRGRESRWGRRMRGPA